MKPQKRVTIKEISKITGFSISTVSKAFNKSYEISQETKDKINKVARELGYRPNKAAMTLRSGKNYVVAVVIPSIEDPFYARIFHGIQSKVANTNYSIITCITRDSYEKETKLIDKVYNQVDAFIISPAEETVLKNEFSHFQTIIDQNKPMVLVDCGIDSLDCSKVLSNNRVAVQEATQKAFQEGYRKVALVSMSKNTSNQWKRKGFLEVNSSHFNSQAETFILNSDRENIEKELRSLILEKEIDCIIATEEDTVFMSIRVAEQLNKKIPTDLALIAYMSEKVAGNLVTPITTINQHRKTIGLESMELLLKELDSEYQIASQTKSITPTLIRRKSF